MWEDGLVETHDLGMPLCLQLSRFLLFYTLAWTKDSYNSLHVHSGGTGVGLSADIDEPVCRCCARTASMSALYSEVGSSYGWDYETAVLCFGLQYRLDFCWKPIFSSQLAQSLTSPVSEWITGRFVCRKCNKGEHSAFWVCGPGFRSRGPVSIPGSTRFSEKYWVWKGVHPALWG
jgi:hypothetical protein